MAKSTVKIEVYDWLRGLACLAVIFGHFKPFQIPKGSIIWAVHAFMLVAAALLSQTKLDGSKLTKRLCYLAFIYTSLFLLFRFLFILQGNSQAEVPISLFFLNFKTVFILNPYFTHLWYLFIHIQLLIFIFWANPALKKCSPAFVLMGSLIISLMCFVVTYYGLGNYTTILIPSWLFVVVSGWYLLPPLTEELKKAEKGRLWRLAGGFLILALIFAPVEWAHWLTLAETKTSLSSTLVYFLMIYILMELFFVLKERAWFAPVQKFISLVSRYTLVLYIYHQGFETLVEPYHLSREELSAAAILTGLMAGAILHRIFSRLEKSAEKWIPKKTTVTCGMQSDA